MYENAIDKYHKSETDKKYGVAGAKALKMERSRNFCYSL